MSDTDDLDIDLTWREKGRALWRVAKFQPKFAVLVIALSIIAAAFEGFGLSFLTPIVEVAQSGATVEEGRGLLGTFLSIYDALGVPFTMSYLIVGVTAIMTIRFTTSFLVGWFRAAIETRYVRFLQEEAFNRALEAEIAYFDEEGSDDILNAIVTQAEYAGRVIRFALHSVEQGLLAAMYLLLAFVLAPVLTIVTGVFLGVIIFIFRNVLDAGYSLGDEVADAKEGIQTNAQAGTQGIREVKLFGLIEELRSGFTKATDKFERNRIKLLRNESAITNFYQLTTAVTVFVLIYLALTFSAMSVGELGVFLFAMFRLGPKVSTLNKHIYRVEGELPHLVRTQQFIEELERNREPMVQSQPVPDSVDLIEFDDVWFSYDSSDETVLRGISFNFSSDEFVAFVGSSGAGKSTIASLLARMYEPDDGEIRVDGENIANFPIQKWRSRITVVRQDPHIFNDTLWRNVTAGKRDASAEEVEKVCEIAQLTEFLSDLPDGYDTVLGDQGVKLSGGQRQRVAIARALLKDAELLILDEATSDLDTSLENDVHEGIESMENEYSILVIAHRLSTVTNADRIYTMSNGKIIESGTHDELLSNHGKYHNLYSSQIQ
ncbi:ABC transporter ATP-binding protein [Natrinema limicola]|uniref:ABC transporter n=1 Tax=Natrinema limicola JCM 13563 TaxID=1230457 RepID=M0CTF1_9EURY|nr:ABC transporter ATP-binding protein [Natrinema limicola]ELZ26505.1 ABC transporter [Natrinema limicola JCM 13563]